VRYHTQSSLLASLAGIVVALDSHPCCLGKLVRLSVSPPWLSSSNPWMPVAILDGSYLRNRFSSLSQLLLI